MSKYGIIINSQTHPETGELGGNLHIYIYIQYNIYIYIIHIYIIYIYYIVYIYILYYIYIIYIYIILYYIYIFVGPEDVGFPFFKTTASSPGPSGPGSFGALPPALAALLPSTGDPGASSPWKSCSHKLREKNLKSPQLKFLGLEFWHVLNLRKKNVFSSLIAGWPQKSHGSSEYWKG